MTRPAISLGLTAAPVVTIPARQARAFRVIDNRTSELTSWDTDLLPDELAGLDDLDIFSFDDVLPLAATAGKTDPDDIPETPKNPVSRVGDRPIGPAFPGVAGGIASASAPTFALEPAGLARRVIPASAGRRRATRRRISALDGRRGRNASTFIRLAASRGSP